MVNQLFRETTVGQIIYYLSGKKWLMYDEDREDFIVPERYRSQQAKNLSISSIGPAVSSSSAELSSSKGKGEEDGEREAPTTVREEAGPDGENSDGENSDGEKQIIVDWYSDDDAENPQNWSFRKKALIITQIAFLTTFVYMGSSIYTPGLEQIMEEFHVGHVPALLALSMFVVGYGIGPMLLSPLSENPMIGRTYIYIVTLFVYVILQIPTALVNNIGGLVILRFIAGFFASPALATGGATIGDVFPYSRLYFGLGLWSVSAVAGPVTGPILGGVFTQVLGWRWTFWILMILSGTVWIFLCFFLPETNHDTILYRRSLRLQKLTGNKRITSHAEIHRSKLTAKAIMEETFYRPIAIGFGEPVVFFLNSYTALIYAIMYTWFEAFPIVFSGIHHFNLIEMGLSYIGIIVGCLISFTVYSIVMHHRFAVKIEKGIPLEPEVHLATAILGSFFLPIGITVFSWTSTASIHWIVPIIGSSLFIFGGYMVFQSVFNYLGSTYTAYLASVFASNDLYRSVFAAAFPLFATQMFTNLGPHKFPVGFGGLILTIFTLIMIPIPIILSRYGPKIRERSKYLKDHQRD